MRADAHNCIAEGCKYGYVKANCSEYLWVCRQSGLPHICSMFQCNIFHLAQGRTCPISGNNFANIGLPDCSNSEEGVERRLSELDADERANYGIGVQGAAKTVRARHVYREAITNFASVGAARDLAAETSDGDASCCDGVDMVRPQHGFSDTTAYYSPFGTVNPARIPHLLVSCEIF